MILIDILTTNFCALKIKINLFRQVKVMVIVTVMMQCNAVECSSFLHCTKLHCMNTTALNNTALNTTAPDI